MMVLVTGGSKCGKSRYGEDCFLEFGGEKFYIATMEPYGREAQDAVKRHRDMRAGKGFVTVEKYRDIQNIKLPKGCGILLECLGNLCANELFENGDLTDQIYRNKTEKILEGCRHLRDLADLFVVVTNDVGSDGISYESGTCKYIQCMGTLNRVLGEMADQVVECVYGIPVVVKGKER